MSGIDPHDCYPLGDIKGIGLALTAIGAMREVRHGRDDRLPPPMVDRANLPWARRERADGCLRRALNELQALAKEDPKWASQYESLAYGVEVAVSLVDAIEDMETEIAARKPVGPQSVKVRLTL